MFAFNTNSGCGLLPEYARQKKNRDQYWPKECGRNPLKALTGFFVIHAFCVKQEARNDVKIDERVNHLRILS
jgi:hypothetical protein